MTNETKGAGRAVEDSLCWGIFRERAHSPGRETDDEAILRRTGERLTDLGYDVRLLDPADIDEVLGETRPKVFMMCEQRALIDRLAACERAGGTLINAPSAILNTYRDRMAACLGRAEVPFPEHRFTPTDAPSATVKRCLPSPT